MSIVRKFLVLGTALLLLLGGGLFFRQMEKGKDLFALPATAAGQRLETVEPSWIVGPGMVEPLSKELFLGFDVSGVVDVVLVKAGDAVEAGQALVVLRHEEQTAQLALAKANLRVTLANEEMHLKGARPAEVERAAVALSRAEVRLEQATREVARRQEMIKFQSIGIEELERALRDAKISQHELDEAKWQLSLAKELFREEEIVMAQYQREAAEAQVLEKEAALDKTILRAPLAGTVLRVFKEPGEAYSVFEPSPVLSMGDTSTMRVRVEVDERDVARVREGQKAYVSADAFGDKRFAGVVTSLEQSMTPKRIRTGSPSEPIDRSVLEVLLTLESSAGLFSGLRVDAFVQADPAPMRHKRGSDAQ